MFDFNSVPSINVENLRKKFKEEYEKNPSEYDEVDYKKLMTNDRSIGRYIIAQENDLGKAYEVLLEAMKWRKTFGVNQIKATDFAMEYFRMGTSHIYYHDKNGTPTIYHRVKYGLKLNDMQDYLFRLTVFQLEMMEAKADQVNDGYGIIFDFNGASLSNFRLPTSEEKKFDLLKQRYYPGYVKYVVAVNLPWTLSQIFKIISMMYPKNIRDVIKMLSAEEAKEFIGVDHIPNYLGGKFRRFRPIVKDCPTFDQVFSREKVSEKTIRLINKRNEIALKASDEEEPDAQPVDYNEYLNSIIVVR